VKTAPFYLVDVQNTTKEPNHSQLFTSFKKTGNALGVSF